jgi:carbamoyl-phosphate synthase small subunit
MSSHSSTRRRLESALLVLSDGTAFEGEAFGAEPTSGVTTGEAVFNTVMAGYQEVITDPSYAGQVVTFTYPHIGNYGVSERDRQADRPHCRGVIVRELAQFPSNHRSEGTLDDYLQRHGVAGITGIDTRRLTKHIRDHGSMSCAFGTASESTLLAAARAEPGTLGLDLVSEVTRPSELVVPAASEEAMTRTVVAYDFGIKQAIIDQLALIANVILVPATTDPGTVLDMHPSGVFLSSGPGDPAGFDFGPKITSQLVGQLPIFGVCLGYQLLGQQLDAATYKLRFGHHGGNHPIQDRSGRISITSQNHNYAVRFNPEIEFDELLHDITHVNINDHIVEGFAKRDQWLFGVQFHPEAGPGPSDAQRLFREFGEMMDLHRGTLTASDLELWTPETDEPESAHFRDEVVKSLASVS